MQGKVVAVHKHTNTHVLHSGSDAAQCLHEIVPDDVDWYLRSRLRMASKHHDEPATTLTHGFKTP